MQPCLPPGLGRGHLHVELLRVRVVLVGGAGDPCVQGSLGPWGPWVPGVPGPVGTLGPSGSFEFSFEISFTVQLSVSFMLFFLKTTKTIVCV